MAKYTREDQDDEDSTSTSNSDNDDDSAVQLMATQKVNCQLATEKLQLKNKMIMP